MKKLDESQLTPVRVSTHIDGRHVVGDFEVALHGNDTATVRGERVLINGFEVNGSAEFTYVPVGPVWGLDGRYSAPVRIYRSDRAQVTDAQRGHWVAACRIAIAAAVDGDAGRIRLAEAAVHYTALGLRSAESHVEELHRKWAEALEESERASETYAKAEIALDDLKSAMAAATEQK